MAGKKKAGKKKGDKEKKAVQREEKRAQQERKAAKKAKKTSGGADEEDGEDIDAILKEIVANDSKRTAAGGRYLQLRRAARDCPVSAFQQADTPIVPLLIPASAARTAADTPWRAARPLTLLRRVVRHGPAGDGRGGGAARGAGELLHEPSAGRHRDARLRGRTLRRKGQVGVLQRPVPVQRREERVARDLLSQHSAAALQPPGLRGAGLGVHLWRGVHNGVPG